MRKVGVKNISIILFSIIILTQTYAAEPETKLSISVLYEKMMDSRSYEYIKYRSEIIARGDESERILNDKLKREDDYNQRIVINAVLERIKDPNKYTGYEENIKKAFYDVSRTRVGPKGALGPTYKTAKAAASIYKDYGYMGYGGGPPRGGMGDIKYKTFEERQAFLQNEYSFYFLAETALKDSLQNSERVADVPPEAKQYPEYFQALKDSRNKGMMGHGFGGMMGPAFVRFTGEMPPKKIMVKLRKYFNRIENDERIAEYNRAFAVIRLGWFDNKDALPILIELLETDSSCMVRSYAAQQIVQTEGSLALRKVLGDDCESVRERAVESLGDLRDFNSVDNIMMLLNDDVSSVVSQAAIALGKIGDIRAIEPLEKTLNGKKRELEVAVALGKIDLGNLLGYLEHENKDVRSLTVWALKELADERSIEGLIKALQSDKNNFVRSMSAQALGKIGNKSAIEPLVKALANDSTEVKCDSAKALGLIGGDRAIDSLLKALDDDSINVKENSIGALRRVGDERALKKLKILASESESHTVQRRASLAISSIQKRARAKLKSKRKNESSQTSFEMQGN